MLSDHQGKKLYQYMPDYVVFDLETTGTSPNTDAVVEISAVKVLNGQAVDEFTTLVNPGRRIPYFASAVNGITDDMVADAPDFATALAAFLDFAGDMVLVGHNISSFDMKFLYRDAQSYWGKIPDNDYIDTLQLSRKLLKGLAHHRLVDLAEYYRISTRGAHRALNDCRMNQLVFERLAEEMKKAPEAAEEPLCPNCGKPLKKRSGRFGAFWGCSGFPDCRFTRNCKG